MSNSVSSTGQNSNEPPNGLPIKYSFPALFSNKPASELVAFSEDAVISSVLGFPEIINQYGIDVTSFSVLYARLLFDIVYKQVLAGAPVSKEHILLCHRDLFLDAPFLEYFEAAWIGRDKILSKNLLYYLGVLKENKFRSSFEALVAQPPEGETTTERLERLLEYGKQLLTENTVLPAISFESDWASVLEIADNAQNGIFPHALFTGFKSLDLLLGEGILDDYLVILGADSGAGKTSFALNVIKNISIHNKYSTLYMSFEMGRVRLMRWFMACCTGIAMRSIVEGKLSHEEWTLIEDVRRQKLCPDALVIVEAFPEIMNIVREIRAAIADNSNVRMIVIDHLHLMHWAKSTNPTEAISFITKTLKHLAMELQIPIMLLSQLKKPETPIAGMNKERRDPHVSDLKGSGSIISDADLIMILQIDPSCTPTDEHRFVRNYILKNRGGRADGAWVGMAHKLINCNFICN